MERKKIKYMDAECFVYVDTENPGIIQRTWLNGGFYEAKRNSLLPFLYSIYQADPKKFEGKTIVDCGANIGNHSLWFNKVLKPYKVISVEPDPKTFDHLVKNIKTNRLTKQFELYQSAVSDSTVINGTMKKGVFYPDEHGTINSITLDALVVESDVAYIKLDIEGHELKALQGAKHILSTQKPMLSVECFSLKELDKIITFLNEFGYKVMKHRGHPLALNATPTYIFT